VIESEEVLSAVYVYMKRVIVSNSKKGGNLVSIKYLKKRVTRLFKKADELQDKWRHNEATEKEIRNMNLLYTEALAIGITLEATGNI